jgi:TonB family protein
MPDETTYAIILRSPSASPQALRITLYSVVASYEVQLPDATFGPVTDARGATTQDFETRPYFVTLPKADVVIGASVQPASEQPACDAQYILTDYLLKQVNKSYEPTDDLKLENVRLQQLFVKGLATIPTSAGTENAGSCAQPYASAKMTKEELPNGAMMPRLANGEVSVLVGLDSRGAVTGTKIVRKSGSSEIDNAVLEAAKRSTYQPPAFLCRNIAGLYLLRVGMRTTTTTRTSTGGMGR